MCIGVGMSALVTSWEFRGVVGSTGYRMAYGYNVMESGKELVSIRGATSLHGVCFKHVTAYRANAIPFRGYLVCELCGQGGWLHITSTSEHPHLTNWILAT